MGLSHKDLLIEKYNSLRNWEPDYEEVGIQFGPSNEEIEEVANEIKKIDPNWLTVEEIEAKEEEEYEQNTKDLANTEISRVFSGLEIDTSIFYSGKWTDVDYVNLAKKFVKQVQNQSLEDLTNKQIRWFLNIAATFGYPKTARRLAEYFQKTRTGRNR